MLKKILIRFINSFCYSIAITMILQVGVIIATGKPPMLPEFIQRFDSELMAFAFQLLLVGLMSGVNGAGTAVFEARRIGLMGQSLLFLMIMLCAWIPVACYAWGFHKYPASMAVTVCSIVVSYGICWVIQYKLTRKDIEAINAKLSEKERGMV